jgi:hypothetical protein
MAKAAHAFRPIGVVIETNLPPAHGAQTAAFSRWQVVLGEKEDRRVLRVIDLAKLTIN